MNGIYIQVYPSSLIKASRMEKIARSTHAQGLFDEVHMVGVLAQGVEPIEHLAPGLQKIRLAGSSRRGTLGRLLRGLLWQPRVFLRYRRAPLGLVAAHNVWLLPMCWFLARVTGATLIFNAHELETESIAMHGAKKRLVKLIERLLIGRCDAVSVVNDPIADWYEDTYAIGRPLVVGNMPEVREASVHLRDQLQVTGRDLLYVHTGNLVDGRNIPLILEAFAGRPHHVVFLGDGHLRALVLSAARRHPNIHWLPPVEPDLIVAHVQEADVALCLIECHLDLSDKLSSPNKLMEALAAGVPPLCSDLVVARQLLREAADQWVLRDPFADLSAALDRITKEDSERFREAWPGMPQWEEEVRPLMEAYELLIKGHVEHPTQLPAL